METTIGVPYLFFAMSTTATAMRARQDNPMSPRLLLLARLALAACLPGGAGAEAFEFRKMGVALLAFQGAARAGRGQLIWLLPPRILRAAR